jgi:hypothetical protein
MPARAVLLTSFTLPLQRPDAADLWAGAELTEEQVRMLAVGAFYARSNRVQRHAGAVAGGDRERYPPGEGDRESGGRVEGDQYRGSHRRAEPPPGGDACAALRGSCIPSPRRELRPRPPRPGPGRARGPAADAAAMPEALASTWSAIRSAGDAGRCRANGYERRPRYAEARRPRRPLARRLNQRTGSGPRTRASENPSQ